MGAIRLVLDARWELGTPNMMNWIAAGLVSAFFLGLYDVFKKRSVSGNAVIPVLFAGVCGAAAIWLPWIAMSYSDGYTAPHRFLQVDRLSVEAHLLVLLKSAIVGTSWILSYFALKNLPVSLATGIRATSPLWTLAGALAIFGESPNGQQWLGMGLTIVFFALFSLAGKREGIVFHRNGWVGLMVLATVVGGVSSLFDKYLLSSYGFRPSTLQAYFSLYLVAVLAPFVVGWRLRWWPRGVFQWRWSIPLIAVCLLIADFVYFSALTQPDAMISVLACLRRASALVAFVAGYVLFKERNYRAKTPCLIGILLGIIVIVTA